jgi:uncharacterized membrane protein
MIYGEWNYLKGSMMSEEPRRKDQNEEHCMNYLLPIAVIAGLVALLIVISGQDIELPPIVPEESYLEMIAGYVVIAIEAAAALIIGSAVARAFISFVRHLFDPMASQINSTERIRLRLGHVLNLGLEFAMAGDILRLAVSPSTADIIILFTIVLLRILLNYFLEREIRSSAEFCGPGDYIPPEK